MFECFHCCRKAVVWDSDFDFSDFGLDGEGIVHMCHCTNCGAEIEYKVSIPDEDNEDDGSYA
jgi:transcription elongation factor Elf1